MTATDKKPKLSRRRTILYVATALLAASNIAVLAWRLHRSDRPLVAPPKPIVLDFAGPFKHDQRLTDSAVSNSAFSISFIKFSRPGSDRIDIISTFEGKQDMNRRMRFLLWIEGMDGKTYTVKDEIRTDNRIVARAFPKMSPLNISLIPLPIKPESIRSMHILVEQISGS